MPPGRSFSFRVTEAQTPRVRAARDATVDIDYVFRSLFGQKEYRGAQRHIMEAALQGHDILVLAPTGYGKSLCFQVPALSFPHGITIVVSPLLALMRDQVNALRKLGIPAASLTSSTTTQDRTRILRDLRAGHPKLRLLYIAPERLTDRSFLTSLRLAYRQNEVLRLVIDEAHVIPSWGDSFRPEYGRLGKFREVFPKVPIMALTASATDRTAEEIMRSLRMNPKSTWRVSHGVDRPNLFYEIRYDKDDRVRRCEAIADFLTSLPSTNGKRPAGIIYCRARNSVEELANYLRGRGFSAAPYHKGLDKDQLTKTADLWQFSQQHFEQEQPYVDCLCATVAFGMGIDKADVRFIIHYDMPTAFEGYYQETGRAGRDGQDSRCLLFYSREDGQRAYGLVTKSTEQKAKKAQKAGKAEDLSALSSMHELIRLCESATMCRHRFISQFFGDRVFARVSALRPELNYMQLETAGDDGKCQSKMCDVCRVPKRTKELFEADLTESDSWPPEAPMKRAPPRNDIAEMREALSASQQQTGTPRSSQLPNRVMAAKSANTGTRVQSRNALAPAKPMAAPQAKPTESPFFAAPRVKTRTPASAFPPLPQGTQKRHISSFARPVVDLDAEDEPDWHSSRAAIHPASSRRSMIGTPRASRHDFESFVQEQQSMDIDGTDWRPPKVIAKPAEKVHIPTPKPFRPPARVVRLPGAPAVLSPPAVRSPARPAASSVMLDLDSDPVVAGPKPKKKPRKAQAVQEDEEPPPPKRRRKEEIPHDFLLFNLAVELQPQTYDKPIPLALREEGVQAVAKHIGRALLAREKVRSKDEEAVIFACFGLQHLDELGRIDFVIAACMAIENEVFWQVQTSDGFIDRLSGRRKAAKALSNSHDWFMRGQAPADTEQAHVLDVLARQSAKMGGRRPASPKTGVKGTSVTGLKK